MISYFALFILLLAMIIDRERNETLNTHLDGMSSDDEIPDHEATLYKNQLSKINTAVLFFFNVNEWKIENIS